MMALQVASDLVALISQHPFVSCSFLVFLTPPFFPIIRFFSPLLISTCVFILALFTVGPKGSNPRLDGDDWELRRAADTNVWEDGTSYDRSNGEKMLMKRTEFDGSSMAWVENMGESGLTWLEKQFKNENWKGSIPNDQNVSILQEPFSPRSNSPATVELKSRATMLRASSLATQESIGEKLAPFGATSMPRGEMPEYTDDAEGNLDMDLGEDAPEVEDREQNNAYPAALEHILDHTGRHEVHHLAVLDPIHIPVKVTGAVAEMSPDTEIDDASSDLEKSRRFMFANVRRNSMNAGSSKSVSSLESDLDSPAAANQLSKSGKLKAIENLGDFMEEMENAVHEPGKKSPRLGALKATSAEEVQDVKEKLEHFVLENHKEISSHGVHHLAEKSLSPDEKPSGRSTTPGSALFRGLQNKEKPEARKEFSYDDETSDEDDDGVVEFSDSDSDDEKEIFPVEPPKMKPHPPVKLNMQYLDKKLGTSLQQPSSKAL